MKRTTVPIRVAGSKLCEAGHVYAFFNSDDEAHRILLPFIKEEPECDDKAVHILCSVQHNVHLRRLTTAGIDAASAQHSGQLELRTTTKAYLRDGLLDQDRLLDVFEQPASSNEDGFPRWRIICHLE